MNKEKKKSFSGQLKKSFIVVILIPIIFLGIFSFYLAATYINDQNVTKTQNVINQNLFDINNHIEICSSSLRYLVSNYKLQDFLLMNDDNYLALSRASKNMSDLFYNFLNTNTYYKSLKLYTDKPKSVLTDFLDNSQKVENESWYKGVMDSDGSFWWMEGPKVYFGQKIMAAYPNKSIGVIRIEVRPSIFEDSFQIFQNIPIKVEISNDGNTLYSYLNKEYLNHPALTEVKKLSAEGWSIGYQVDRRYFGYSTYVNLLLPAVIIGIALLLTWVMICYFTRTLARDLSVLVQEVESVQKGNLDVIISQSDISELNILSASIQNLLNKVKRLISEVYTKEIERQDMELNLLQSKMNPHFLYNNLSAINWLALECGQDKIYEITTELAAFYRTALNKGKSVDYLSVELENIKAYLKLQLIAHEGSFETEIQADEEILNCEVPIFILQPLVENAIEHGIELLQNKRGLIRITAKRDGESICLKVFDNGTALYQRLGKTELPLQDYGYAAGNVRKRLQLLYDQRGGIKITADENGTTACVSLMPAYLRHLL